MQLLIRHELQEKLILPLNYHHILQAIIYRNLNSSKGYDEFLHDEGYFYGSRNFKMFTFSLLQGKYDIVDRNIVFRKEVFFEVRSPDIFMIKMLADNISRNGIDYGERHIDAVEVLLGDETVEESEILVKMVSPVTVYTTIQETGKTYFHSPDEPEFARLVNENFIRKYIACYGAQPEGDVLLRPVDVGSRDKYVTNYKNFYISGWMGTYCLNGQRKYLDFLFQAGLGNRNSQGFGMFNILY